MRRSMKANNNPSFVHGYATKGTKRPNIYRRWQHMIQRCHNPNDTDYHKYGARGITVCDRWRKRGEGFINFVSDMGMPESSSWTLDRIDNNGNYEPSNCRWATVRTQANNRRSTRLLTIRGITQPLTAWANLAGIGPKTILYRLNKMGMSHEDAVYTPSIRQKK